MWRFVAFFFFTTDNFVFSCFTLLQFLSTTSPSKRCSGLFNQCISAASNKHSFRQAPSSILIGRVLFCLPLCPLHCKQLPKAVCQIKDISRQCNLSIITSAEFYLMLSGSSKHTTYFSSIINLRCGRYFTFCVLGCLCRS